MIRQRMENIAQDFRTSGKYFYHFGAILTLVLSICAVLRLQRDNIDDTLTQNHNQIESFRLKITPCPNNATYPIFLQRISRLLGKIEAIKASKTRFMAEVESTLESNISEAETMFNERLTVLQNQVSDLKTNVNKLQTNFASFKDLTGTKFKEVWKKFDKIEAEIAQKRG